MCFVFPKDQVKFNTEECIINHNKLLPHFVKKCVEKDYEGGEVGCGDGDGDAANGGDVGHDGGDSNDL